MSNPCHLLMFCWVVLLAAHAAGQQLAGDDALDPRFQEDRRIESDTPLGRFSVGVSGITEDARSQSTRGDVEFGTFYDHEFDAVFPRVLELRPFVFNRIDSTETEAFASLGIGIGVGTRLSLRKKHEESNWFARVSVLTPSELYRERYGSDREDQSIAELFAGFEFTLNDATPGRAMRDRMSPPHLIQLRVPARMVDPAEPIDPDVLKRVHTLMVQAYLTQVRRLVVESEQADARFARRWPVLHLVESASGQTLGDGQRIELNLQAAANPGEDLARRQAIASDFLERGLTAMMRVDYPLLITIRSSGISESSDKPASASIARMSFPGTNPRPRNEPLDADTMIRHYIESYREAMR